MRGDDGGRSVQDVSPCIIYRVNRRDGHRLFRWSLQEPP
jgi:hypothetical protein